MFDSSEINAFHKTVGLTPLYRGKSLIDPKEAVSYTHLTLPTTHDV